uniref:Profilin n=1 Tax=Chlorella vulgaris TaxID=3077 RepID=I1VWC4_CHLVU|nr:truncated profilin [Chlorella vulgaris]
MSWQQFVDDQLMCTLPGGGQLKHAAIWGHDGGVWACDAAFPTVSPEEVSALVEGFNDTSKLAQSGIRIGGEKYVLVAGEPGEVLRGKKGAGNG